MATRVYQSPLVMLAVDFNQAAPDLAQELNAYAYVVEKGAASPVSPLHSAEHDSPFGLDAVLRKQREDGVEGIELEGCRHLALGRAPPDERHIASGAECKRERVQQNRFAGAGLASEHGQSRAEFKIELVDQDDIADRECR